MQFKLLAISALVATAFGSKEKAWSSGSSVAPSWTGTAHTHHNGTGTSWPTWTAKSSGTISPVVKSTGHAHTTATGTPVSSATHTGVTPFSQGDAALPTAAVGLGFAGVIGVVGLLAL